MSINSDVLTYLTTLHQQADNDYNYPLYVQRYMAIAPEQGQWLYDTILSRGDKNIVEFGASFGVSTIYLAAAAKQTGGSVITTECEPTKIPPLRKNLQNTNFIDIVDIRIGNALETLVQNIPPIDLLLMDGYKTMYPDLFTLLEPYFKPNTIIIADNTDMKHASEFKAFLKTKLGYKLELKQFERSEMSIVTLM